MKNNMYCLLIGSILFITLFYPVVNMNIKPKLIYKTEKMMEFPVFPEMTY